MCFHKYFYGYIHNSKKASKKMDQDKISLLRSSKHEHPPYNFLKNMNFAAFFP